MEKRLPNLDGLRTLAATAVVLGHSCLFFQAGQAYRPSGWVEDCFFRQAGLGVQFFFVLSGFLITRIALAQMDLPQGFSLKRFWLRRILRIWPVYFLVVLIAALLAAWAGPLFNMVYNNWWLLLSFLENYDLIGVLSGQHAAGFVASVLWSVSIEEQFYLVYPLLLWLVPRRFYSLLFLAVVLLAASYKMYTLERYPLAFQFSTFSACYELGIGCLAALWFRRWQRERRPRWWLMAAYAGLWLPLPLALMTLVRPLLFVAIILDQAFARSPLQTGLIPGLNWLGQFTYGVYAYHMILVMLLFQFLQAVGWLPKSPIGFAAYLLALVSLTFLLSWCSYRFMERPILKKAP